MYRNNFRAHIVPGYICKVGVVRSIVDSYMLLCLVGNGDGERRKSNGEEKENIINNTNTHLLIQGLSTTRLIVKGWSYVRSLGELRG